VGHLREQLLELSSACRAHLRPCQVAVGREVVGFGGPALMQLALEAPQLEGGLGRRRLRRVRGRHV